MNVSRDDRRLPAWAPRAVALLFVGLAVFIASGWLLLKLRELLIMLLVSLVFSFALEPAVNRLAQLGLPRAVATLITFLISLAGALAFLFLMGRLISIQVVDLIDRGPEVINDGLDWLNRTFDTTFTADSVIAEFNQNGRLGKMASDLAPDVVGLGAWVIGFLFQLLTVAMFTFYLVSDGPRLRRTLCSAFTPERQRELLRVWELGIDKTGGYIYSRAVLGMASMLVHWLAFAIIGLPSPLALGLWVGVISQFIPVVGTYLAGVLPVAIALSYRPISALWVIAVVLVYQQVENYLLAPRITAQTMEIHPAVAFGSVIAGGAILGAVGTLLALPVAATATALASTYFQRHDVVESHLTGPPREHGPPEEHRPSGENGTGDPAPH